MQSLTECASKQLKLQAVMNKVFATVHASCFFIISKFCKKCSYQSES